MKQLVCESLQEFYLVESVQEAQKKFKDANYELEDELPTYFFDAYKDTPEYMSKLADWIIKNPEDIENVDAAYLEYLNFKKEKLIDKSINDFEKLKDFQKYIKLIKQKEKQQLSDFKKTEKEIGKTIETPPPKPVQQTPEKIVPEEILSKTISDKEKIEEPETKMDLINLEDKKEREHTYRGGKAQIEVLRNWWKDCFNERRLGWGRIPKKYRFLLGGVTEEEIKSHNCEADYIWATDDMFSNRLDLGLQPKIKSGSASGTGDPFQTIKDTQVRGTSGEKIVMAVYYAPKRPQLDPKQDNPDLDKKYHPLMIRSKNMYFNPVSKKEIADAGTEMFYIDRSSEPWQVKADFIAKVLTINDSQNIQEISPNKQQTEPSDKINENLSVLRDSPLSIFLGYKCRFPGKTITVLNAFFNGSYKFLLVFARRRNVAESWARNTQYFRNMTHISLKDFLNLKNVDVSKKYVISGTVQSLEDKTTNSEDEKGEEIENEKLQEYFDKFLSKIKNQKFWIALDEAHQGGIAPSTVEILKKFSNDNHCQVKFDISGTGQKLFKNNEYDLNFHYDIINENDDREKYIKTLGLSYDDSMMPFLPNNEKEWIRKIRSLNFKKDPDARVILSPKKITFVMRHEYMDPNELARVNSINANPGIPLMTHLLTEDENGNTRFPNSVDNIIDWCLGEGDYKDSKTKTGKYDKGFINEGNRDYLRNWGFMGFVKEIVNGKVLEKSFNRYKNKVEIINICGNYMSQEELNRRMQNAIFDNHIPIILSCGSHGEASDLDRVIATFHFNNGTSGETQTQRGSRGGTSFLDLRKPDENEIFKSAFYDIYFDMSQALKVSSTEIIKRQRRTDAVLNRVIEQYRKANPLYSLGLELSEIDSNAYQIEVKNEIEFDKIKKNIINLKFDKSKITSELLSKIDKILLKGINKSLLLGIEVKKAKGDKRRRQGERGRKKNQNEEAQRIMAINRLLDNIVTALDGFTSRTFFTLNDFTSIDDLFQNMNDKSFKDFLLVPKDVYTELIKIGAFDEEGLNLFLSTRPRERFTSKEE